MRGITDSFVPAEVRYACQYWAFALNVAAVSDRTMVGQLDNERVDAFPQTHVAHWLEVLSLIRSLPKGVALVPRLENHAEISQAWVSLAPT